MGTAGWDKRRIVPARVRYAEETRQTRLVRAVRARPVDDAGRVLLGLLVPADESRQPPHRSSHGTAGVQLAAVAHRAALDRLPRALGALRVLPHRLVLAGVREHRPR